jgi:hypothetical protein
MDTLSTLIQEEEARLAVARRKVADLETRIAVLRQMQQRDALDSALDVQVGRHSDPSRPAGHEPSELPAVRQRTPKGTLPRLVLRTLGAGGVVSLDSIEQQVRAAGVSATRAHLRTILMNLRIKDNWVANPAAGRYALTEEGMRALEDAQSETASALTEAVSGATTTAGEAEDSEL